MEATIDRKALRRLTMQAKRLAGGRVRLPALSGVRIEADGEMLTAVATDLETCYVGEMDAEVGTPDAGGLTDHSRRRGGSAPADTKGTTMDRTTRRKRASALVDELNELSNRLASLSSRVGELPGEAPLSRRLAEATADLRGVADALLYYTNDDRPEVPS